MAQVLVRNLGICFSMLRENSKRKPRKDESTDEKSRGGTACSSDETAVMAAERRGCVIRFWKMVNRKGGANGQNKVV